MGKCRYCGHRAGLLSRKHRNCQNAFENGKEKLRRLVIDAILHNNDSLLVQLNETAADSYIGPETLQRCLEEGWIVAVAESLADSSILHATQNLLIDFAERYIQLEDPEVVRAWDLMELAVCVKEISEGYIPQMSDELVRQLPINFSRWEQPVHMFRDVQLLEEATVVVPPTGPVIPYRPPFPVDMSKSMDRFRYRVGESMYNTINSRPGYSFQRWEAASVGHLVATTQHIYYVDNLDGLHTLKIPYDRIVAITSDLDDGTVIALQSGKNYAFEGLIDDELAASLILLLARSSQGKSPNE